MRILLCAATLALLSSAGNADDRPLRTGWYTGNSACPFVEGLAVASMPAQAINWDAPACCEVPTTVPSDKVIAFCEGQGWRRINGRGWDKPERPTAR